jgi:predicted nucleic acid-binding Zn ribbon protein
MKPKKAVKGFVPIGTIINSENIRKTIQTYRCEGDAELAKVWNLWEDAVGEGIAQNARPAAFKGKLLLVNVTNPIWIQHLQFEKSVIIKEINKSLEKNLVDDIKFQVGQIEN